AQREYLQWEYLFPSKPIDSTNLFNIRSELLIRDPPPTFDSAQSVSANRESRFQDLVERRRPYVKLTLTQDRYYTSQVENWVQDRSLDPSFYQGRWADVSFFCALEESLHHYMDRENPLYMEVTWMRAKLDLLPNLV